MAMRVLRWVFLVAGVLGAAGVGMRACFRKMESREQLASPSEIKAA